MKMNMKRFMNKKVVAIGLAAGITLGGAGAAFAYFTASGSGSGTAAVGNASNVLVVTGTPDGTALTPNGPGSVISFTVANPSSQNEYITEIDPTGVSVNTSSSVYTSASSAQKALWNACDTTFGPAVSNSDPAFSMANVTGITDGDIVAGATAQAITETGTLHMNDTGVNQDNCEGAPLSLSFTTK
jgi:hypothetical protein